MKWAESCINRVNLKAIKAMGWSGGGAAGMIADSFILDMRNANN